MWNNSLLANKNPVKASTLSFQLIMVILFCLLMVKKIISASPGKTTVMQLFKQLV